MNLFLSLAPILLLMWMMGKRKAIPSFFALPIAAVLIYLIQWLWFKHHLLELTAYSITGIIAMLTPISIVAGAFLLNRFQQLTGIAATFNQWLQNLSPNPIAQLMLIAWAFSFLLEGASGFGAPLAIATPILVGLGFKPIKAILTALAMNTIPVSFAAVGTTMWFGFSNLNLSPAQFLQIGQYTVILHCCAGLIIPLVALRFCSSWQQIRQNIVFIYLSIFSCLIPYFITAQFSYEFPSLFGGVIGLTITAVCAKYNIGLAKKSAENHRPVIPIRKVLGAISPTLLFTFILIITRIQPLGIKDLLTSMQPWLTFNLASLAELQISTSLTISLVDLFGVGASGSYKLLFVPALIPFVLVVLICAPFFNSSFKQIGQIFVDSGKAISRPLVAMSGALIMVNMLTLGGEQAPVHQIGTALAQLTGHGWLIFAPIMGAIGTFFSGSSTVSNLAFGAIQQSIATNVGLSPLLIIALQSVGSAMGVMASIHNIIVVSTILGMPKAEGEILKKILPTLLIYAAVVAVAAIILLQFIY